MFLNKVKYKYEIASGAARYYLVCYKPAPKEDKEELLTIIKNQEVARQHLKEQVGAEAELTSFQKLGSFEDLAPKHKDMAINNRFLK